MMRLHGDSISVLGRREYRAVALRHTRRAQRLVVKLGEYVCELFVSVEQFLLDDGADERGWHRVMTVGDACQLHRLGVPERKR